jgi:peptidoglycan lytic transglycosylase
MQSRATIPLYAIGTALFAAAGATPVMALPQCGEASWYDQGGTKTASGGIVDPTTLTAAHRSLPFGTHVHVENLRNGRTVHLKIDDRGPFISGRVIDVSRAAAEKLGFKGRGITRVRITEVATHPTKRKAACK